MKNNPIGNYEKNALLYAQVVDTKPIHIYYERPHTWSLLPQNLTGLKVLDIGCGSGWYAEQLLKSGAEITAIDASEKMIELTQARCQGRGDFTVANAEEPLDFLQNESFDIVLAPLVIHYVENFLPLFTELARILKMDGLFIFSTHQPHTEFQNRKLDDYYKKVLITDLWKEPEIEVQYYHHTLHELTESLYQAGFVIERMLEPMPMTHLETAAPEMFKQITTQPWFLFVRAKKVLRTSKDNV